MQKFIIFALLVLLIFPLAIFARIGVGIDRGQIYMNEPLKSGGIYELSVLKVQNTGDEGSYYELGIAYKDEITDLKTPKEWFSFSPDRFYLEPGESQQVAIKLTVPLKAEPGNYFNYIQAHPPVEAGAGTSVGIAVAAKLFFTVAPANFWQAITWRVSSFWRNNSPWTWVVLAMILAAAIIVLLKKNFAFQIGTRKKKKKKKKMGQ
jgi:P pilus assembly chaperone PapD